MTSLEYRSWLAKKLQKEADDLMAKYHLYGQLEYLFKYRQTVTIIGIIQGERANE